MLRTSEPFIAEAALILHDEQLQPQFKETLSCKVPDEAIVQAARGVRNRELWLWRVVDLDLPAFIAPREESKEVVVTFLSELLNSIVVKVIYRSSL